MKQEVYLENGSIHFLKVVLQRIAPKNIFLVHGKSAYALSGAEAALSDVLPYYQTCYFCEFEENPKIDDLQRGLKLFQQQNNDIIVAVGGGSVLDMAKLIRILSCQNISPVEIVHGQNSIHSRGVPLIAIPTTAGTGSEATHFAVIYINREKFSIAHEYVLPDVVIIDPDLTYSLSPKITATTGMDALSQAIESYWCVNSTYESKGYAKEAISLVLKNLARAVHEPTPEIRYAMCTAAYLAGQAINITKTTAPHAISYPITSYFGVPHGHAVGLTLGEFLIYNSQVVNDDVTDYRGASYVREIIKDICELFEETESIATCNRINNLMQSIGLKTKLGDFGIMEHDDYELIVENVNLERLGNNPRNVTKECLISLMKSIS